MFESGCLPLQLRRTAMNRNRIRKSALTALLAAALCGPAVGQVELISRAPVRFAPDTGDGDFTSVALSDDGRYAAFSSAAANLVPGQQDSNRKNDVFLYDRLAGTTILVSHAAGSSTLAAQGESGQPALSGDGRFVAFISSAWDLVPGVGDPRGHIDHLYLWSRETGEITPVTRRAGTEVETGHSDSRNPVLSRNGNYLAFLSQASDLIPGQVQGFLDENVFLYERETGILRLVSHSAGSANRCGNGSSGFWSGLSADGRFVVYWSNATDLVTGQNDANQSMDVFLYDRLTDASVLVSHAAGSALTTSNDFSIGFSLSADGQFVVFESRSTDLVSGIRDDNQEFDSFLYDRLTGTVTLLSLPRASGGFEAGGWAPEISRDGRTVVFLAGDTLSLVAVDRLTGARTLVTASSSGSISVSDDGRRVAFQNGNQLPGQVDDNKELDVFLHDRATGITTLVSHTASDPGKAGDRGSTHPVLSADGQWIAYASLATDLTTGVRHGDRSLDLLLYETTTAVNRVVTLHAPGMASLTAPGGADEPSVSADGRYVAFTSPSDRLYPTQVDRNRKNDVFLYDRVARRTTLISRSAASAVTAGNAESSSPRISRDGAWIAFQSRATDLVPGQQDLPGSFDVFLYERRTGTVTLVSHSHAFPLRAGRGDSSVKGVSADGGVVVFNSLATNLVPRQRDAQATQDVFVYHRRNGIVTLVSRDPSSSRAAWTGNSPSLFSSMSPDGAFVTFISDAGNLVPDVRDTNGERDAFLWESRTDRITLVSRTRGLSGPASLGDSPLVSANGRWVAFLDLGEPPSYGTSTFTSLKVLDRTTGSFREVVPPGDVERLLGMSDDGRFILWTSSRATFLLDRISGENRQVIPEQGFSALLSADGRWVAFTSDAQALLPDQRFPAHNVFLYDWTTDEVTVVSRSAFHPTYGGSQTSLVGGVGADGHVVFTSYATDLIPRDFNSSPDVFLYSPGEQP